MILYILSKFWHKYLTMVKLKKKLVELKIVQTEGKKIYSIPSDLFQ